MDVDLIFKIAGIGIIVAVLNLVLKRAEPLREGRTGNDDHSCRTYSRFNDDYKQYK